MENTNITTNDTSVEAPARSIEIVTAEILAYKQQAGYAVLEIGRRLNEAKELLPHGEWLPWLKEQVEFSEATAQRFMRLAREYPNPSPVTDLGASKALLLLVLPEDEREKFLGEKHEVNGEEKTAFEMSKSELAAALRERDEARRQAEEANTRAANCEEELRQAQEKAAAAAASAQTELEQLQTELADLKAKPVEVATVVDQEAVDAAADKARKEAEAALAAKIDKAEKALKSAKEAKKKAEDDLAAMQETQKQAADAFDKERKALAAEVQTLQKKLTMASSNETAVFKLYFDQTQSNINKMTECVTQMIEGGNADGAEKLKKALIALLDAAREVIAPGTFNRQNQ